MTPTEELILRQLELGYYNDIVLEEYKDARGYLVKPCIKNGIPCIYEKRPIYSPLRGKESPIGYSKPHRVSEHLTPEDKLLFFKQEGFRMENSLIFSYSINDPEKPSHLTLNEKLLLNLLRGVNERVGKLYKDSKGRHVSYLVTCGIPQKYEANPIKKRIDGRLEIIDYTDLTVVKEWRTEKEQLFFLMQYGHYMEYEAFQEYSKTSGHAIILPKIICDPCETAFAARKITPEMICGKLSYPKTEEELILLERLKSQELDGKVGDTLPDNGYGSSYWFEIIHGIPMQIKLGPGGKFFNNRENEHWESEPKIIHRYRSNDEKILFLRKYGWLMNDHAVKEYSAKYKDKAKQES